MKKSKIMPINRLVIIGLFIIAVGCVVGILNGMYNMGNMANAGEPIGAQAVEAMSSRATTYGLITFGCLVIAGLMMIAEWRTDKAA